MVFLDFFYLLRSYGLSVSLHEWMTLLEALDKGLAQNSFLRFYHLARGILIKTEADFDRFDQVFLNYFRGIQSGQEIPAEFYDWLNAPKEQKPYDKDEVDGRTDSGLDRLLRMLEQRLQEQHARHDGGPVRVGTGGSTEQGHVGSG